jgi:hypothetical protein
VILLILKPESELAKQRELIVPVEYWLVKPVLNSMALLPEYHNDDLADHVQDSFQLLQLQY